MMRKKFRAELSSGFTIHLSKAWPAVLQLPTHLQSKGFVKTLDRNEFCRMKLWFHTRPTPAELQQTTSDYK